MKEFFVKTVVFLKRVSILYRLAGIVLALIAIFTIALPDLQFNMASGKPVEMTLDQLFKTPTTDLPRYLKITDAVVPSGSYVEIRKATSNSLQEIYYPVYPSATVKSKLNMANIDSLRDIAGNDSTAFRVTTDASGGLAVVANTNNIEAKLVIHDTHVTDKDLDSLYFSSPDFSIEGRYSGTSLPDNIKRLLTKEDVKISDNVIMLSRGDKGMDSFTAIMLIIGAIVLGILCILTLIPNDTLASFAGFNSWAAFESATTSIVNIPANITIAPMGKRILAFVIDFAIITGINYSLPEDMKASYLYSAVVAFIYFIVADIALKGSSLGKMAVRQKVVLLNGDLTVKEIVIRNLVKALCNMFPLIFLYAFSNDAKQTIHDMVAKTVVAETGNNSI
ncbi:RDD family protein [Emticicia fontis]